MAFAFFGAAARLIHENGRVRMDTAPRRPSRDALPDSDVVVHLESRRHGLHLRDRAPLRRC